MVKNMAKTTTTTVHKPKDFELLHDKPAKSLLKAWSKKMSKGTAIMIPVFVGGQWTLQVPRGNKRILQVPIKANI